MSDTVNNVIEWGVLVEDTVAESAVPATYNTTPTTTWTTGNDAYAYRESVFVRGYDYIQSLNAGRVNISGNVTVLGSIQ